MNHPVPDPSREVKGYIIFRDTKPGIDSDDPEFIVHVSGDTHLRYWDDDTSAVPGKNATKEWTYIGRGGDEEDASYDITYNHRPLEEGRAYYYVIRRIVSPYQPQIPIATQQARPAQAVQWEEAEWDFEPNMNDVLSRPSSPLGPVSYVLPATPNDPPDGSTTVNPQQIRFRWTLQTTPDEGDGAGRNARYVLVVFKRDNLSNPVFVSEPLRPTATTMSITVNDPDGHVFQPNTDYVWMVGHYVEGEPAPEGPISIGRLKPIVSTQYQFRTVALPPGATAAAHRQGDRLIRRGPFGEIHTRPR
ncbi:MAG: hypothetical protein H5T86_10190 [Armatimonadetes bacterium]|nr:hypothetical protein [Armatimonadota bacterium]